MVVRVAAIVGVVMGLVGAADAGPGKPKPAPYITGPKLVELGNHAEIDLPAGMILFERGEAQRLLRKVGEPVEGVVAIVQKPEASWSVIVSYADAGYVDDSDASALDGGELLAEYRSGNGAQSEGRRAHGTPELVIDGWTEPPRYERAQHRLAWGVAAHAVDGKLVNHVTRILGRDGFLSVNLIDGAETMDRSRREARSIVQATRFQPGSRYEDHTPGDRRSGAGLRSLVQGKPGVVVAAKLGLLAQIVLAFKLEIVALLVGIGGFLRRLFGPSRRRKPRGVERVEAAAADATGAIGAPC